MKIVSWNMQNKRESWRFLVHPRHDDFDFAFVGEACVPPPDVVRTAKSNQWDIPFDTWDLQPGERRKQYRQEVLGIGTGWRIERLSRNEVVDSASPLLPLPVDRLFRRWHRAAIVTSQEMEFCLVCVVSGHSQAQSLPALVAGIRLVLVWNGLDVDMPMIVAGDLTTNNDKSKGMFEEMNRIGLPWAGPRAANYIHVSGRRPDQRETPETAYRRLNHVFVCTELKERVSVTALNDPDLASPAFWGPSDHCRLAIEVQ